MKRPSYRAGAILLLLCMFAGVLRLYQLGADDFWFDEFGVANIATVNSLSAALDYTHFHVMAMPMDYLITWLLTHFNRTEGFLRLPAAVWGTLTIIPAYFLFSRLANQRTAIIAVALLAVSPLHVQYSQELRFYASLVFFYLLSTGLLISALEQPSRWRWVIYTFITVIGIYFHIYVFFAVGNGILWIWFCEPRFKPESRLLFLRSTIITLIALIAGLYFFAGKPPPTFTFLLGEPSIWTVLGKGLGWLPFYTPASTVGWLFGGLCLLFAMIGGAATLWKGRRSPAGILLLSTILQIAGITLLAYLNHYFIAPRQYLAYLPLALFFAASGIEITAEWIGGRLPARITPHERLTRQGPSPSLSAILTLLVVASSLPALVGYYQGDKGHPSKVAHLISQIWQPGDRVLFDPGDTAYLVQYYLAGESPQHLALEAFSPFEIDGLSEEMFERGRQFLVTGPKVAVKVGSRLSSYSLKALYLPDQLSTYSLGVWQIVALPIESSFNPGSSAP